MTVQTTYLSRIAADSAGRIQTIKLNDTIVVQKDSVVAEGPFVTIKAHSLSGISRVTSIKAYDENQKLICNKVIDIMLDVNQIIDFVFTWEVIAG